MRISEQEWPHAKAGQLLEHAVVAGLTLPGIEGKDTSESVIRKGTGNPLT
jgi:hypothetical protein